MKCEECLHYEVCKSLEECNGIRMIKADNCNLGLGEVDEEKGERACRLVVLPV